MKKIFIKDGKWHGYERPEFGTLTHDDNAHQDIVEEYRSKALEITNPEIIPTFPKLPINGFVIPKNIDPNWDYDWPGDFDYCMVIDNNGAGRGIELILPQ